MCVWMSSHHLWSLIQSWSPLSFTPGYRKMWRGFSDLQENLYYLMAHGLIFPFLIWSALWPGILAFITNEDWCSQRKIALKSPYWKWDLPIFSHPESVICISFRHGKLCYEAPFCFCCFQIFIPSSSRSLPLIKSCKFKLVFQFVEDNLILSLFTFDNYRLSHLTRVTSTSSIRIMKFVSIEVKPWYSL